MNTELSNKIIEAREAVKDFYEKVDGKVWISFSGGKDSTVLLHLVRSLYPNIKAVFSDTGLEFFEIKQFVRTIDNVDWIRPTKTFRAIIEQFGVPYPSKVVADKVYRIKYGTPSTYINMIKEGDPTKKGGGVIKLPTKWTKLYTEHPYLNLDFNSKCCSHLKHSPFAKYVTKNKAYPYVGSTKAESHTRNITISRQGLNIINGKKSQSRPLGNFTEQDIWDYIHYYDLPYSKIYDMGYKRTGCMFCLMGIHMEKGKNRLEQLRETHPKQHKYILSLPGYKELLDLEGIRY